MSDAPVVRHNTDQRQYETTVDGHLARLTYERDGDRVIMSHTLVPPPIEGRGVAAALVEVAVGDARDADLTVVPACSYVDAWLRRNPDQAGSVKVAGR
jgi:uncharacterized protein